MRQAARHEAMMKANLDEYERKRDSEDTWKCVVCEQPHWYHRSETPTKFSQTLSAVMLSWLRNKPMNEAISKLDI
jgi:hypothetical protein